METSVEVDQSQVTDVPNAADHTFRWVIHNPCVGILPDADLLEARLATSEDWQQVVVQRPGAVGREAIAIDFTRALNAKSGSETVTATLGFRPTEADEFEPLAGSENTVHVNWSWRDYASDYLRRYWRKAVATYFALFGALMIASRRSRWAWGVVTDPWWGKVGLPYWFALRHVPALQRWILARWFGAMRPERREDYLPVPLTGPQGAGMASLDLAGALKPGRRVWLQGAAGMGKTALVGHAVAQYCDGAENLGQAFRRWGYVPLPIALRDYASIKVSSAPEDWIFDLAGRWLEAAGLPVEDMRLLRGIVTAGYVVLLLDGANEVDDGGAIQQFALRFPQVGMLVTSQVAPRADVAGLFEVWRLPDDIRAATGPLLDLYLGADRGGETFRALESSPIAGDIRSGYDVRLIADLVEAGTAPAALPQTRLGLYDAMLAAARNPDGSPYPVAGLCEVAWKSWVAGRRDLEPGTTSPPSFWSH